MESNLYTFAAITFFAGVRLRPMSWVEAETLINDSSLGALSTLGRLPLEIKRYREFRKKIATAFASITDYLLVTIFGCKSSPNEGERIDRKID